MDGYGVRDEIVYGNAIKQAHTPNIDYIMREYPHILLDASGEPVGLPEGQMGNSEVGHMNIGAGRVVYQSLSLINKKIKDNTFFQNESLIKAIEYSKKNNSILHLFCLLSDGGVHSHIDHLLAMMELAKKENVENLYLHLFLDGRDVHPQSSEKYLKTVENKIKQLGIGVIATVSGRYYAMDRDTNYDRTYKMYEAMVDLKGNSFDNVYEYVKDEYVRLKNDGWDSSDEFVMPAYNSKISSGIQNGDSIVFLNFRPDRAIQLSMLFTNYSSIKSHINVATVLEDICYVSMMKYNELIKGDVAFENEELSNILGEYLADKGYTQLRIAETEKYAHVTFFFDGTKNYDGVENEALKNCERILVDSPKVSTYDLKPEMSAYEVCEKLVSAINSEKYDVIIANFANCDMVGHTAVWDSVIKAVEVVDECVGNVYEACKKTDTILLLTADHGNADIIYDLDGSLVSSHTTSPVPLVVTDKSCLLKEHGKLADLAPTILYILGECKPKEMTGDNLIIEKGEK
jgi:2,3-bisphosphoglycerate-independent phosphoglycerate mutase